MITKLDEPSCMGPLEPSQKVPKHMLHGETILCPVSLTVSSSIHLTFRL